MTGFQVDRPQRKVSNWISGGLVVALLIGAVVMGFLDSEGGIASNVPAPEYSFERFSGGRVTSADMKGKVVMLDFWATWCPPCIEEMPMLVKLAKEYEAKGVAFVAVSHDDPEEAEDQIRMFINHKVRGVEPYVAYGNVSSARFKVRALPTMYVIDGKGRIVGSQTGLVSERKMRSWLDKALLASD